MDSVLYKEVLVYYLFPFIAGKYNFDCILHQDNDSKHHSVLCWSFLEENGINWVKILIKNF